MDHSDYEKMFKMQMSDVDFQRLSKFIYENYGIKLPPVKKVMLQSRIQKRLRELEIESYRDYVDFVLSKEGIEEVVNMIDVVSTNKTDFFREAAHFDFMQTTMLPEMMHNFRPPLKVWSAGCSTGEEPYTLAMVLSDFKQKNASFDFTILATDISTKVLQRGMTAIYDEERVNVVSLEMKRKYLLRSKDKTSRVVRIVPDLRRKIQFKRLNFIDNNYDAPVQDVVMCRNVLIYFDRITQEKVIQKLCSKLRVGGYFFLGHSESIMNLDVPLKQIKPTIFQRI